MRKRQLKKNIKKNLALGIPAPKPTGGFMVSYEEKIPGNMLRSGYLPDKHRGEPLIKTKKRAWALARKLAKENKGKWVNLYVVDHNFSPVKNYRDQYIKNR